MEISTYKWHHRR